MLRPVGLRVGRDWWLGSNSRWRPERSREGASADQECPPVPVRAKSGLGEAGGTATMRSGHRGRLQDWMMLSTRAGRGAIGQQAIITATEVSPSFFTASRCSINHHPAVYFSHLQMRKL